MKVVKRFQVEALLTVTTDRLLCDIANLYEILGWMTNDKPFTHQLPRFGKECKPWLLRWFPVLVTAGDRLGELDAMLEAGDAREACKKWVSSLGLDAEYNVQRIPMDDHDVMHPVEELIDMVGPKKVAIIRVKE